MALTDGAVKLHEFSAGDLDEQLIEASDERGRIAFALNFHDQSHFIRDIEAFSGMTPKSLSQKVDDFYHDQAGYSFE